MDVRMLQDRTIELSPTISQTFPAGWTGGVHPDLAKQWIEEFAAEGLGPKPGQFTAEQTQILADAAEQIAEAQRQAAQIDNEPPTLESLSDEQLHAMAGDLGIAADGKSREELIGEVSAAIERQNVAFNICSGAIDLEASSDDDLILISEVLDVRTSHNARRETRIERIREAAAAIAPKAE